MTVPTRYTVRPWLGEFEDYAPTEVPSEHIPTRRAAAEHKFADLLDSLTINS